MTLTEAEKLTNRIQKNMAMKLKQKYDEKFKKQLLKIGFVLMTVKEYEQLLTEERRKAVETVYKELQNAGSYCLQANGLPYCKNCGLDFPALMQKLREVEGEQSHEGKDNLKGKTE
jgi:hypothetical protein